MRRGRQLRTAVIGWLVAASAFLATATRGAEPLPGSTSLLIRYVRTTTSTLFGTRSTGDSLIYRDGLVIERVNDGGVLCWVLRGTASPEELGNLLATLATNRIGQQQGNCQIKEPIDNFHVETQVTWFGKGNRQHRYQTSNEAASLCPAATMEIDQAIQSLLATAGKDQTSIPCPV